MAMLIFGVDGSIVALAGDRNNLVVVMSPGTSWYNYP